MINKFVNPNRCFQLDTKTLSVPKDTELPNNWLEKLKGLLAERLNLDTSNQQDLASLFARINGYKGAKELTHALKIIYHTFPQLKPDEQIAIAKKFMEETATCVEGFHNRVNEILIGLQTPTTIPGLLTQMRMNLVYNTALKAKDDVHNINDFFRIACQSGYGVTTLNNSDTYSGGLTTDAIEKLLGNAFAEQYTSVAHLLLGLQENIRGILTNKCGYIGRLEISYEAEVFDPCFNYLKELLPDLEKSDFFVLDDNSNLVDFNWRHIKQLLFKKLLEDNYFILTDSKRICLENLIYNEELAPDQLDFSTLFEDEFLINIQTFCAMLEFLEPSPEIATRLIEAYLKARAPKTTNLLPDVFTILQSNFVKGNKPLTQSLEDQYHDQFMAYSLVELPSQNLAQTFFNKNRSNAAFFVYCLRFLSKDEQFNCLKKIGTHRASGANALRAGLHLAALLPEILKIVDGLSNSQKLYLLGNSGSYSQDPQKETLLMSLIIEQPHLFPTLLKVLETLSPDELFTLLTKKSFFDQNVFISAARFQPSVFKLLLKTIRLFTKDQQLLILKHTDIGQQNIMIWAASCQPALVVDLLNILEQFDQKDQEEIILQKSINDHHAMHFLASLAHENLVPLLNKIRCFGNDKVKEVLLDNKNPSELNVLQMAAKRYPKKGVEEFFNEIVALPFDLQLSLFKRSSPLKLFKTFYRFKNTPQDIPILVYELKFQLTRLQKKLSMITTSDMDNASDKIPLQTLISEMLEGKQDWKTKKLIWDKRIKTLAPQIIQESTLHKILSIIGNVLLCLAIIGIPKIVVDMSNNNQRCGFFKPAVSELLDDTKDALLHLSKIAVQGA